MKLFKLMVILNLMLCGSIGYCGDYIYYNCAGVHIGYDDCQGLHDSVEPDNDDIDQGTITIATIDPRQMVPDPYPILYINAYNEHCLAFEDTIYIINNRYKEVEVIKRER